MREAGHEPEHHSTDVRSFRQAVLSPLADQPLWVDDELWPGGGEVRVPRTGPALEVLTPS